jgi:hypothetical protein
MWFLIASGAGLTTLASIASSLVPLRSRTFGTAGLLVFGLEPYVILSNLSPKGVDLFQILAALDDVRSSLPRAVVVSHLTDT